jgi:two-component system alkaline phosphatase synthesis response regulator PhoP
MDSTPRSILLVDDEESTLDFLEYNLAKNGFDVFTAKTGKEAIRKAEKIKPKLILLDVMMPGMDGIEICLELRKNETLNGCMIAFLTCRGEDYSQIIGFNSGADDYIKKPIRINLLLFRLEALLKRSLRFKEQQNKKLHGIYLIKDRYSIVVNQKEISLSKKEFDLINFFISNPEKAFTRDEILCQIWGEDTLVGDRAIDVYINRLRKKTGHNILATVKGYGYKLNYF